ncbi:MAG: hypothetical protein B7X93_01785 [Hydrogenophilales bacterium 17-61-9]|nr:MAG: hypothetical protein B7X93_01785 [Hydrogenophilales bacterium 17-61-9]
MPCPRHPMLSAYMDDSLSPRQRRRLAAHLDGCAICRRHLEALLALRQACRSLPAPARTFDLSARVAQRIRQDAAHRRPAFSGLRWSGFPGSLAAAFSLAAGVWLGGLWVAGAPPETAPVAIARVFDPVPPGGLCAAPELCGSLRSMQ